MVATTRIVVLAGRSVVRFLTLAANRRIRLRRDRLGQTYGTDRGGNYEIFRETVRVSGTTGQPVVLVVGFRLKLIGGNPLLHRLFQRLCILTTPFWSGFRGFRVKLWMVDPETKNYLGIYDWAGAANAGVYVEALVRVLHPLSTPGSVWHDLFPDQAFESFLQDHARSALTPSGGQLAHPTGV